MSASNSQGEFRIENIPPGKYSIFNAPQAGNETRTDSAPFEVTDQDVTGLVVKTIKPATVTGVLVIEARQTRLPSANSASCTCTVTLPVKTGAVTAVMKDR
jgi:hypothetical protein